MTYLVNQLMTTIAMLRDENAKKAERISELERENAHLNSNGECVAHELHDARMFIKELEAEIGLLAQENENWRNSLPKLNIEMQIKALEELLTYPNHRFHGDDRLYYSQDSIKRFIEQLYKGVVTNE
jgi:chromosome segregation ATPase